jgi:hypothetical protein
MAALAGSGPAVVPLSENAQPLPADLVQITEAPPLAVETDPS